jgi:acetyl-CoA acetyltransferase
MGEPVILEAVRTPIGKRNGALRAWRPDALYARVLDALLERTGIDPALIGDVVTGCVTQVGEQGANVGRLAVLLSRLPKEVPAVTLNRMCGSSQQAVHFAAQAIAPEERLFLLARDEGVRPDVDYEKMLSLKPFFRENGVVTAGNSSQVSDGAAALLLGDREKAQALGLKPRARFLARVVVAGDPTLQLLEVIPAAKRALERARLSIRDIDVVEVNEAFASVVLAFLRELGPDPERLNPNGGAIAHGHPLGATGAILMTKLLHELEQTDGEFGLQVMCIGHGQATATVIQRI